MFFISRKKCKFFLTCFLSQHQKVYMKEPVAKEPVYWNDFTLWDTATRYSRCGQILYYIIFSRFSRSVIAFQYKRFIQTACLYTFFIFFKPFLICLGYFGDMFWICLGYAWDYFWIILGYVLDMLGIFLGYCWDILGIF